MAYNSQDYGDPLQVVMRRQSQSCHGCVFETEIKLAGDKLKLCAKLKQHGKKCKLYQGKP